MSKCANCNTDKQEHGHFLKCPDLSGFYFLEQDDEAAAIAAAEQRGYAKAISVIESAIQTAERDWEICINPDLRGLARERYITLCEMVGKLKAK